MDDWLRNLPKAELHLHVEGTLEPAQMFALAERNGVTLPFRDVEQARAAYRFNSLQSFLDLYHQGMTVLCTAEDFHDLAGAYFERAHADGVVHADVSFDPQAHLSRGVPLTAQFEGLLAAMGDAQRDFGMSSSLVMSFLRDRGPAEALDVFELAAPWHGTLAAIGLDNAEMGHPPGVFRELYERAGALGLARTAHAGEEGPPAYVIEALDILHVDRIDHGVRCVEDPDLLARLQVAQTPLTVCPLSNVSLRVVDQLADHQLPHMWDAALNISINSDDPAYLGGGIMANFDACQREFRWDYATFRQLATNSIRAAFMPPARRAQVLDDITDYCVGVC